MAWLSSLAKCKNKTKKTPHRVLNLQTFCASDFYPSTHDFSNFLVKKSPDFFYDFLRKKSFLSWNRDLGDLLVIFVTEISSTHEIENTSWHFFYYGWNPITTAIQIFYWLLWQLQYINKHTTSTFKTWK
jgi:hypothetical protein